MLNKVFSKLSKYRTIHRAYLCTQAVPNEAKTPELKAKRVRKRNYQSNEQQIRDFFAEDLKDYVNLIPKEVLTCKRNLLCNNIYIMSPKLAARVASHIVPKILANKNQMVGELQPGFGFLTRELLNAGVSNIRLFEGNATFRKHLKQTLCEKYSEKLDLTTARQLGVFNMGNKKDISSALKGVPKKSWTDDPVMTLVGTMTNRKFLNFLIKSIIMQTEPSSYGRTELFCLGLPLLWQCLTANENTGPYLGLSILYKTLLDVELLEKYPRKYFLPWQTPILSGPNSNDNDFIYLMRITAKKEFLLRAEEFVPFFYFIVRLQRLSGSIVARCEEWVPGCGKNIIVPKLNHEDYFEDINIFTKAKELNIKQLIGVFREMVAHPRYKGSAFMEMVEHEMFKAEVIQEAGMFDYVPQKE